MTIGQAEDEEAIAKLNERVQGIKDIMEGTETAESLSK